MPLGNFAVSTTHRPLPSTTGPLLSHFIQKSSRLMYTKPCAARPLFFIASACALIAASVGVRRTKLQLLQPIAGLVDSPLSDAFAGCAPSMLATVNTVATDTTVSAASVRILQCGRILSPSSAVRSPARGGD